MHLGADQLDFNGVVGVLHGLLGEHVAVTLASASAHPKPQLVAMFAGELQRAHVDDHGMIFVIGGDHERGFGHIVLSPDAFERATLDGTELLITSAGAHVTVSTRPTLLEEEER